MSRHHSVLVPVVMCVLSAYCTTTGTTINVSTFIQVGLWHLVRTLTHFLSNSCVFFFLQENCHQTACDKYTTRHKGKKKHLTTIKFLIHE